MMYYFKQRITNKYIQYLINNLSSTKLEAAYFEISWDWEVGILSSLLHVLMLMCSVNLIVINYFCVVVDNYM